jgi:5'-nucleotidase
MSEPFAFSPVAPELLKALGLDDDDLPKMDPTRRVYANRDLPLKDIRCVGFDMDYTLGIYQKKPMEQLQYDLTVRRLIDKMGYPPAIEELTYDPTFIIRGLTVDKRTGAIVKMDTHGSVLRAFKGRTPLSSAEIEKLYKNLIIRLASDDFASLDTLFAMPEACLYANLVGWFSTRLEAGESVDPIALPPNHETANLGQLDTWKLFHDVRTAIDDIHRDGTLKSIIMDDVPTYLVFDEGLPLTLHKLRSSGKKLFLLTNSYWTYTEAVMTYLLDGRLKEYPSWRGYFDAVIVGGRKPGFFTRREPFLEVQTHEEGGPAGPPTADTTFDRNKVYQHGNMEALEKMMGCQGEEIVYVGDHIFGDILRSKKDTRWRTCLIVEELEEEIRTVVDGRDDIDRLALIDEERHAMDDDIGHQRSLLSYLELALGAPGKFELSEQQKAAAEAAAKLLKKEIDQAKRRLRDLDKQALGLQEVIDGSFNPTWGRLLKEHNELSRFGLQVSIYADTYTSRVSNFLQYSPVHYFRAPRELMAHDYVMANSRGLGNVRRLEDEEPERRLR